MGMVFSLIATAMSLYGFVWEINHPSVMDPFVLFYMLLLAIAVNLLIDPSHLLYLLSDPSGGGGGGGGGGRGGGHAGLPAAARRRGSKYAGDEAGPARGTDEWLATHGGRWW